MATTAAKIFGSHHRALGIKITEADRKQIERNAAEARERLKKRHVKSLLTVDADC